jgi:CRP/FNR family transcriptional regulator
MTNGPDYHFLQTIPVFSDLPDEVLKELLARCRKKKFRSGQHVFYQDDTVEHLYIVEMGLVEIYKSDINGRKVTLWHVEAGKVFCLANLFAGRSFANALAQDDCLIFCLPRRDLDWIVAQHHELALHFITCISSKLAGYATLLEDFTFKNVQERLIKILLTNSQPDKDKLPVCSLSQSELACRLGTCREVVSRSLTKLKNEGLLDTESSGKSSRIKLKDPVRLQDLGEPS